ncbi:hypothetical protein [Brevibacillus laterosporus]|uniref:hypothetical protein n=1 Tax=Brevibacillus laterosporus TaxID=1465 RepID=UPI000EAF3BC0|nr:hypothetical protein [Brevibacillus laterosporus]AYK07718.1 hypothetical protein D8Z77_15815 [Brevibacillus laterosporus]
MVDWHFMRTQNGINAANAKSLREDGVTTVPIDVLIAALVACYRTAQQAEKEVSELRERLMREEMRSNLFAMYGGVQ